MKMVSGILAGVEGNEVYAVAAMLFFLAIFLGVSIWLLTVRKGYYSKASMMPLEDDDLDVEEKQTSNH